MVSLACTTRAWLCIVMQAASQLCCTALTIAASIGSQHCVFGVVFFFMQTSQLHVFEAQVVFSEILASFDLRERTSRLVGGIRWSAVGFLGVSVIRDAENLSVIYLVK